MSNNSVYSMLNTDSIINEIKLTLSATPNTPFIIVEGIDDINFFKHHCPQNVVLRESFKGKCGVYQIVNYFNNKKSVIGICDRDYDNESLPIHIFTYDYSCLEVMLFANKKTKDTVFIQLNIIDKITFKKILNNLCWLSLLRKINFQNKLNIRLEGLHINNFFEYKCGLNKQKLKNKLIEINSDNNLINNDLINSIDNDSKKKYSYYDHLNITQGHDLLSLIKCYHAYYIVSKNKTMSENDIRALLYCSYVEKFNKSKIYKNIIIYGKHENITFLKDYNLKSRNKY